MTYKQQKYLNFDPKFELTHNIKTKVNCHIETQKQPLSKVLVRLPKANCPLVNHRQNEQREEREGIILISSIFHANNNVCKSEKPSASKERSKYRRYVSNDMMTFLRKQRSLQASIEKNELSFNEDQFIFKESVIISKQVPQKCSISDQQPNKRKIASRDELDTNYTDLIKQKVKNSFRIQKPAANKSKLSDLRQEKKKQFPLIVRDPEETKHIKSQHYTIVELDSKQTIISNKASIPVEIASLTKIMTFYTIYKLSQDFRVNIFREKAIVSSDAFNTTGTSAELAQGEEYTIQQLLYGLMLPSGNDAANELAIWASSYGSQDTEKKVQLKWFTDQMNSFAKKLGLKNSKFMNVHGLPHQEARSTATDMAKLCCECLKIDLFSKIVSTKKYKILIRNTITESTRLVEWENTNKLLRRQGFLGIKTGITVTAGPCLASAYRFRDKTYIIVLLRAPKISSRFKETRLLLLYVIDKLFNNLNEKQKQMMRQLKHKKEDLDSDNSEDQHEFKYDQSSLKEYKKRCQILDYEL